jgi:hypothetical protein
MVLSGTSQVTFFQPVINDGGMRSVPMGIKVRQGLNSAVTPEFGRI